MNMFHFPLKGNLSLLDIYFYFSRGLNQMEAFQPTNKAPPPKKKGVNAYIEALCFCPPGRRAQRCHPGKAGLHWAFGLESHLLVFLPFVAALGVFFWCLPSFLLMFGLRLAGYLGEASSASCRFSKGRAVAANSILSGIPSIGIKTEIGSLCPEG